jgi:prefoldin subunit 5
MNKQIETMKNSKRIEELEQDKQALNKYVNNLFKVVDKLEQRIATLEKVLDSHAKCIGEMREDKKDVA